MPAPYKAFRPEDRAIEIFDRASDTVVYRFKVTGTLYKDGRSASFLFDL